MQCNVQRKPSIIYKDSWSIQQSSFQQLHHIVLVEHKYNNVECFVAHLLRNSCLRQLLLSNTPNDFPFLSVDLQSDHLPVIHNPSSYFFPTSILANFTIIWVVGQTLFVII